MPFESSVDPLHGLTTGIGHPELRCLRVSLLCAGVQRVGLDNGHRSVLALYEGAKLLARVPCVSNHVLRMEARGDMIADAIQYGGGNFHVSHVAPGQLEGHRQLALRVHSQRELVAPDVLLLAVSVPLDHPSSILITGGSLGTIRPGFEISGVYGDRLPEFRQRVVEPAGKPVKHLAHVGPHLIGSELGEEPREGWLTRYAVRRGDATGTRHEGIVPEVTDEVRDGREAQVVVGHVAAPEDAGIVSFGATSPWASELRQEFFIGEYLEDSLKLSYNRRGLIGRKDYCTMSRNHREGNLFLWLGAAGC